MGALSRRIPGARGRIDLPLFAPPFPLLYICLPRIRKCPCYGGPLPRKFFVPLSSPPPCSLLSTVSIPLPPVVATSASRYGESSWRDELDQVLSPPIFVTRKTGEIVYLRFPFAAKKNESASPRFSRIEDSARTPGLASDTYARGPFRRNAQHFFAV